MLEKTVNWLRATFVEPGGAATRQRVNSTVDLGLDNNLRYGSINRGNPEEGQDNLQEVGLFFPQKTWRQCARW